MKTEKEISDELIPVIRKHYRELLHWTSLDKRQIDTMKDVHFSFRKGSFTYHLYGEKWWDNHIEIGGLEMISFKIQNISLDANNDGIIDSKELEEAKENRTKVIEQCLSQMLNYGVIGGLAVSVLYAVSLNSLVASESTTYYLNQPTILAFYYIYYTFLYFSMMQSFLLIYKSSRAYLQLSIWMPTLDMKHWYISEISMTPLIYTTTNTIQGVAVSIPFGATVSISPAAGLIALGFLGWFYFEYMKTSKLDTYLGYKIHDFAKKIIDDKVACRNRKCLEEIKCIAKLKKREPVLMIANSPSSLSSSTAIHDDLIFHDALDYV